MTNEEIINVVQSHQNGAKIERRCCVMVDAPWVECNGEIDWDFKTYEYRVKKVEPIGKWEEYCNENLVVRGYLEAQMPFIGHLKQNGVKETESYYSPAFVVLAKLIMLRDWYNDGWKPDWFNNSQEKYVVRFGYHEDFRVVKTLGDERGPLVFPTLQLADKFSFDNMRLIYDAKDLL